MRPPKITFLAAASTNTGVQCECLHRAYRAPPFEKWCIESREKVDSIAPPWLRDLGLRRLTTHTAHPHYTYLPTYTHTQTHRHTDTQTHRHTHTDTQTHRHTQTQTHTHTQTHRHTDTQTHRHTDTQTHRHTDTQTHRHTDTQTHRHTDTQTLRHSDTHCTPMQCYSSQMFPWRGNHGHAEH